MLRLLQLDGTLHDCGSHEAVNLVDRAVQQLLPVDAENEGVRGGVDLAAPCYPPMNSSATSSRCPAIQADTS